MRPGVVCVRDFPSVLCLKAMPKFALIEVEGGFIVEPFNGEKHLSPYGWSKAGVTLFSFREEVEHLRDQILN